MKYLQFLSAVVAIVSFPAAFATQGHEHGNKGGIDNDATFVPIQATLAALAGVGNNIETRDNHKLENSATFVPIQATLAALSAVGNDVSTGKRGIDNDATFVPIQATLAGLAGVANEVATSKRGIDNDATFVPIQATIAALAGVANEVTTSKRGIDNDASFVPIQASADLISIVTNGVETRDIKNSATFVPIQATAALLSEVNNNIVTGEEAYMKEAHDTWKKNGHGPEHRSPLGKRSPLADSFKVPVGNQDLLREVIRRYAAEYDSEKAKRDISHDGRGQRPRPRTEGAGAGMCSIGEVQCCNQVIEEENKKKALAGLLSINDILTGNIGLNCNSIPIAGALAIQNQCKSTPVCCQNVTQDGLINFGCTALPIN
ncbi:hypothetical protein ACQY0O_004883 [Thecaphora frezii]